MMFSPRCAMMVIDVWACLYFAAAFAAKGRSVVRVPASDVIATRLALAAPTTHGEHTT